MVSPTKGGVTINVPVVGEGFVKSVGSICLELDFFAFFNVSGNTNVINCWSDVLLLVTGMDIGGAGSILSVMVTVTIKGTITTNDAVEVSFVRMVVISSPRE